MIKLKEVNFKYKNGKFSIKRLDLIEALEERRKFFKENKSKTYN